MNIEKLLEELKADIETIDIIKTEIDNSFLMDSIGEYCENSIKKINAFLELYRAEKAKQTNIFDKDAA